MKTTVELSEEEKKSSPLFFNFINAIELKSRKELKAKLKFSEKYNGYARIHPPSTLISKIIDFSLIEE
ncbi:MAG: hypothetical protein LUG96_13250 [Tannerellaceae bacterium]|nr:hypothetical protein [Tannerellaceae bacterium]